MGATVRECFAATRKAWRSQFPDCGERRVVYLVTIGAWLTRRPGRGRCIGPSGYVQIGRLWLCRHLPL
jgi:hypothetical protein